MCESNVLQAHFEESCFKLNLKGQKVKYEKAVPTIDAFTLDPDSDDESIPDIFKPLPLYSSPALQDHSYANLTTVVPDWIEFSDDDCSEAKESTSKPGSISSVENACRENLEDSSSSIEGRAMEYETIGLEEDACCENSEESRVAENKVLLPNENDSDVADEKRTSFKLLR